MRFDFSSVDRERIAGKGSRPDRPLEPVMLPRGELRQPYTMEWWYFIAHLTTESDAKVPEASPEASKISLVCSAIRKDVALLPFDVTNCILKISDHQSGPWPFAECGQPFRGAYTDSPNPVEFQIDYRQNHPQRIFCNDGSWLIQGRPGHYRLSGSVDVNGTGPQSFDLLFRATHPAVPLCGNGIMDYGDGYQLAYYVRPKIEMSGTIERGARMEKVGGVGWFERQWGSWPGDRFGWIYLNLHMKDGEQWLVYSSQRNGRAKRYAARFPSDGGIEEYDLDEEQFQPVGRKGHRSGTQVEVQVPGGPVAIYVKPHDPDDADLDSDLPLMPRIWEGVSEVVCRWPDGRTVEGVGLTEIKPYE